MRLWVIYSEIIRYWNKRIDRQLYPRERKYVRKKDRYEKGWGTQVNSLPQSSLSTKTLFLTSWNLTSLNFLVGTGGTNFLHCKNRASLSPLHENKCEQVFGSRCHASQGSKGVDWCSCWATLHCIWNVAVMQQHRWLGKITYIFKKDRKTRGTTDWSVSPLYGTSPSGRYMKAHEKQARDL